MFYGLNERFLQGGLRFKYIFYFFYHYDVIIEETANVIRGQISVLFESYQYWTQMKAWGLYDSEMISSSINKALVHILGVKRTNDTFCIILTSEKNEWIENEQ